MGQTKLVMLKLGDGTYILHTSFKFSIIKTLKFFNFYLLNYYFKYSEC